MASRAPKPRRSERPGSDPSSHTRKEASRCHFTITFSQKLIVRAEKLEPINVAVVFPLNAVALRGVCEAAELGFVVPTLIVEAETGEKAARRRRPAP
jgi:hypothetical protein